MRRAGDIETKTDESFLVRNGLVDPGVQADIRQPPPHRIAIFSNEPINILFSSPYPRLSRHVYTPSDRDDRASFTEPPRPSTPVLDRRSMHEDPRGQSRRVPADCESLDCQ